MRKLAVSYKAMSYHFLSPSTLQSSALSPNPQRRHRSKDLFRRAPLAVLAALAAVMISASAEPGHAAGEHACEYLTEDQVAAVMGAAVGETERHDPNPMGQSVCFFDIPSGTKIRYAQLQMVRSAWAADAGTNWKAHSLFENNMSFLSDLQEIGGVGEKAYWGGSGMKLGAGLHVLHGDSYFTVQAATGDEQNNLQKAKELAALVLTNIQ